MNSRPTTIKRGKDAQTPTPQRAGQPFDGMLTADVTIRSGFKVGVFPRAED